MTVDPTLQILLVTNHYVVGHHITGAHANTHRLPIHTTSSLEDFSKYLSLMPSLNVEQADTLPDDLSSYQVVLFTHAASLTPAQVENVTHFVTSGGGLLALTGLSEQPLPRLFGVEPCQLGPRNEVRVLFTDHSNPLRNRMPVMAYLQGHYHHLSPASSDASGGDLTTLLYADWRFEHSPVLTHRTIGNGQAAATTLQDLANPWLQQVLYRLILQLAGRAQTEETLGVALLGYSPAVGQLHGTGTAETMGLDLRAICDLSPQRIAEARDHFPHAAIHQGVDTLCDDNAVDLVIIATPPSSHAKLAIQLLNAGKHVVCEKPLALTTAESDAMLNAAANNNRFVGCHQNRRWDVDYMAINQAITQKRIGELFYMETFVGSYNHPCGHWHSHDAISGGTTYDWGAHYLDWTLNLIPETITGVICTRQNRVWHDVTNADQERIQLRFANGQEADFTHSDIAAARKPKWYLLGTEGAIVGDWRDITSYEVDPLRYFNQHPIPPTEMPPSLRLFRHLHPDGEETNRSAEEQMVLPERPINGFYRNLADHLLTGEPVEVPAEHSARVVAVLETATKSAANGGTVERVKI